VLFVDAAAVLAFAVVGLRRGRRDARTLLWGLGTSLSLLMIAAVVLQLTSFGLAGWIVALCVVFWPSGIQLSQTVRFYALHGMLFFIGAVAIYDLCRPQIGPLRRALMLVLALGAFWLAYQFQVSTAVGALAIALWMVGLLAVQRLANRLRSGRGRRREQGRSRGRPHRRNPAS